MGHVNLTSFLDLEKLSAIKISKIHVWVSVFQTSELLQVASQRKTFSFFR